jgi:glycosyltransferase involved in cell wall biosynthesis
MKPGLSQRFHHDLNEAAVSAPNSAAIAFELKERLSRTRGWDRIIRRNEWFQAWAIERLKEIPDDSQPRVLFAYSYAAAKLLRFARKRGWRTVLGQIDPGLHEEKIVRDLHTQANPKSDWAPAPPTYWQNWRDECELADRIVVNSQWSKGALLAEGVPSGRLRVIPLAFEAEAAGSGAAVVRNYPERFSADRPLRVLFLGQVNLRKGIIPLLEAMRRLEGEPVQFWFVGPDRGVAQEIQARPNAKWIGAVPRNEAGEYYRQADVFILPTFSDGFALTQLEASYHRLPMIVSERCGEVVRDEVDGLVLKQPSAAAITDAVRSLLEEPGLLKRFSAAAGLRPQFSLDALAGELARMFS